MTSLQVEYWKLNETTRSNKANENLRAAEIAEISRHNQATEALGWAQLGEASRHNKATEAVQRYSAQTDRIHWTNWAAFEEQRLALQAESNEIQWARQHAYERELDISQFRADTDRYRAEQSVRQQDEALDVQRSDLSRKWVETNTNIIFGIARDVRESTRIMIDAADTIFSGFKTFSSEARGWTQLFN